MYMYVPICRSHFEIIVKTCETSSNEQYSDDTSKSSYNFHVFSNQFSSELIFLYFTLRQQVYFVIWADIYKISLQFLWMNRSLIQSYVEIRIDLYKYRYLIICIFIRNEILFLFYEIIKIIILFHTILW